MDTVKGIFAYFYSFVYEILAAILNAMMLMILYIEDIFYKLCGIEQGLQINNQNLITGSNLSDSYNYDIVSTLMQTRIVKNLLISITLFAILLLIITTIISIIKNQYIENKLPWNKIAGNAVKALMGFILIPITCVFGILIGNIVLRAINGATSNGDDETSLSSEIFNIASYNASYLRNLTWNEPETQMLAMYYVLAFGMTETIDGIADKYLGNYYETSGSTTFEQTVNVFYDEKGNEISEDEVIEVDYYYYYYPNNDVTQNLIFTLNANDCFFDTDGDGIKDKHIYRNNDGIEVDRKDLDGGKVYYDESGNYSLSSKLIPTIPTKTVNITKAGTWTVYGKGDYQDQKIVEAAKANTAESVCLTIDDIVSLADYTGLYGLLKSVVSAVANSLSETRKVSFSNPDAKNTSLFVYYVAAMNEKFFYNENFFTEDQINSLADLIDNAIQNNFQDANYGQVLYLDADSVIGLTGVPINSSIIPISRGVSIIYTLKAYSLFYNIGEMNYFTAIIAAGFLIGILIKLCYGLVSRMIKLVILYIISPIPLCLYPIKDGQPLSTWAGEFVKNAILAYAAIAIINIILALIPIFISLQILGHALISMYLRLIVINALFYEASGLITMLSGLLGSDNLLDIGKTSRESYTKPIKDAAKTAIAVGVTAATLGAGAGGALAAGGIKAAGKFAAKEIGGKAFSKISGIANPEETFTNIKESYGKQYKNVSENKYNKMLDAAIRSGNDADFAAAETFKQNIPLFGKEKKEAERKSALDAYERRKIIDSELASGSKFRDTTIAKQTLEITNKSDLSKEQDLKKSESTINLIANATQAAVGYYENKYGVHPNHMRNVSKDVLDSIKTGAITKGLKNTIANMRTAGLNTEADNLVSSVEAAMRDSEILTKVSSATGLYAKRIDNIKTGIKTDISAIDNKIEQAAKEIVSVEKKGVGSSTINSTYGSLTQSQIDAYEKAIRKATSSK